ncbi:MAG TPA: STAS domain-containing protein [Rhodospirillaceae bacterium]|nr:STAS domain-containing protein [Rhodospirillaceae bacterium]
MDMTVEDNGGIFQITLAGKLDAKGAEAIELKFTASVSNKDRVAVSLTAVDYIASIGIRILVMAGKTLARRGGKLVLFGAPETVSKVLTAAGLTEIVPLVDSWDQAVALLA